MAPRLALLIAALLPWLGGCARAGSAGSSAESCGACHATRLAAHFPDVGSCASCHRGDPSAERQSLAHHRLITGRVAEHGLPDAPAVAEGKRAVERLACRRCHTVEGSGNRHATALDRVVWHRDQAELARSIAEPVENMPSFGLDTAQTEAVIAYLLFSSDPGRSEATYRVRFARTTASRDSRFEESCGGCHRALTTGGPLGRGSSGPNLSGLFTPHFLATAKEGRAWSPGSLGEWLENPRALRPQTTMRPVRLGREELERLVRELAGPEPTDSSAASP